jgi:CO/xanthine dehydrogenase FAD-binding subunit
VSARFARPATLAEALPLLAEGGRTVLAGGTDLYPAHVGREVVRPLLDITAIEGLRGVRRIASGWSIGAATTWTDILRAGLPPRLHALQQAAREVGGAQVQNAATVVGNLCNASPAADGTPVLMAAGAVTVLRSMAGERRVPVVDFVLGNRRTLREPHELVVAVELPDPTAGGAAAHARSIFIKLGGRRYLTISMTMVAVVLDLDPAGAIAAAGVAVGSCSARAQRLPRLEAKLLGQPLAAALADAVEADDLAPLAPLDDLRASARHRLDATQTLLRRALAQLCAASANPGSPSAQPGPMP